MIHLYCREQRILYFDIQHSLPVLLLVTTIFSLAGLVSEVFSFLWLARWRPWIWWWSPWWILPWTASGSSGGAAGQIKKVRYRAFDLLSRTCRFFVASDSVAGLPSWASWFMLEALGMWCFFIVLRFFLDRCKLRREIFWWNWVYVCGVLDSWVGGVVSFSVRATFWLFASFGVRLLCGITLREATRRSAMGCKSVGEFQLKRAKRIGMQSIFLYHIQVVIACVAQCSPSLCAATRVWSVWMQPDLFAVNYSKCLHEIIATYMFPSF